MAIKTYSLGTIRTRKPHTFTGIELQTDKEKLYIQDEFKAKINYYVVDTDNFDKLVEKIAGQQIVTSFYRNDAVISSLVVDVPDISDSDTLNFGKSNKDIVYKFLGTLVAIRMSLRKYYKPIVLHQVPITVRNGGYVFGRDIRPRKLDTYQINGKEPLFLFSGSYKYCRTLVDKYILEGQFAINDGIPFLLIDGNKLYTINRYGYFEEVQLSLISNEQFVEEFKYKRG